MADQDMSSNLLSGTESPLSGWREQLLRLRLLLSDKKTMSLLIALVALIFSRTVDQVIFYRLNFSYGYFVWYLSTIILPSAFLMIFWPLVLYKTYVTKQVTPEMWKFPQYKFAIMGLLDCLYNLFSTFPVQHLGGDLSNVLSQSVLPINMLFAMLFLRTRFKKNHYLGAFLVIYGIAIKLSAGSSWSGSFGWILMLIFAQTPSAASNVYKQLGLQGIDDLDIGFVNACIGSWQLLFGVLTFWTMYIGAFMDPHPALTDTDSFGDFITQANDCFLGKTIFLDGISRSQCEDSDISEGIYHPNSGSCELDCGETDTMAPVYTFMFFIAFNVIFNQLMLYIFKHGSSVLFVVASAVRLPLVNALNSWKWIAGPAHESYHKEDTFALIILIVAIMVYYSEPEENPLKTAAQSRRNTMHRSVDRPYDDEDEDDPERILTLNQK